ncbi:MAG: hypothetical protein GX575_30195 [Candidatus Anammoximicrobium sp.]|nr:hypothetical protein [Candidatus Anammoximicrobium sp.]
MSHSFSCRLRTGRRQHPLRRRASAFTLVEMLVAMVVTLILIGALSQAFAIVGEGVAQGRAAIELSGSMRGVANQLQEDLDGVTVPVRPWTDEAAGLGYFEILEGVGHDSNPLPYLPTSLPVGKRSVPDMYGDMDDVLAFTARAQQDLFVGVQAVQVSTSPVVWNYVTQQSPVAEIVYFTRFEDVDLDSVPGRGELTLHRRVLLVRPDLGTLLSGITSANALATLMEYQSRSDVSARLRRNSSGTSYDIVANSLADLTRRESRFGHWPNAFPFPLRRALLLPKGAAWSAATHTAGEPGWLNSDDDLNGTPDDLAELGWFGSDDRVDYTTLGVGIGEDVVLTDLLAFDVQVFDPQTRVKTFNDEALAPGDPGWWNTSATVIGLGAFVNLNYGNYIHPTTNNVVWNDANTAWVNAYGSLFSGRPAARSVPMLWTLGAVYCTWSTHYERNGVNEDVSGTDTSPDEGTDGFDTDNQNGVDDAGERETSPPYPVPLRGIQVRIRSVEPDTRQVRQVTVVADFVPE